MQGGLQEVQVADGVRHVIVHDCRRLVEQLEIAPIWLLPQVGGGELHNARGDPEVTAWRGSERKTKKGT
eukprot:4654026-Pyramimonas_sp.AAC.1